MLLETALARFLCWRQAVAYWQICGGLTCQMPWWSWRSDDHGDEHDHRVECAVWPVLLSGSAPVTVLRHGAGTDLHRHVHSEAVTS